MSLEDSARLIGAALLCWPGVWLMATARMRRVNEVMREVIGDAIATELEDPRIGFVTVTAVETSPDLRSARVLRQRARRRGRSARTTLAALASAHGVLQAAIAREMRMKRTPTLTFHYDDTLERGDRLDAAARGR